MTYKGGIGRKSHIINKMEEYLCLSQGFHIEQNIHNIKYYKKQIVIDDFYISNEEEQIQGGF